MTKKVYIIGHRNPDTDSIVAAISYARLKQLLGHPEYIAARAGHLSPQTEYILKRFKIKPPLYMADLIPKVEFYMNTNYESVKEDVSLCKAVDKMMGTNSSILPIVDEKGLYKGVLNYNAFALNPQHSSSSLNVRLSLILQRNLLLTRSFSLPRTGLNNLLLHK